MKKADKAVAFKRHGTDASETKKAPNCSVFHLVFICKWKVWPRKTTDERFVSGESDLNHKIPKESMTETLIRKQEAPK
jgi:hypothetical protein